MLQFVLSPQRPLDRKSCSGLTILCAALFVNYPLQVADDCGFLPLAIAIIGAMGSSRIDPHSPETWRGVHARLVEEPTLVQDHVGGVLTVSFRELNEKARARFRKLGVLVRGVRAPVEMVAHLWEQVWSVCPQISTLAPFREGFMSPNSIVQLSRLVSDSVGMNGWCSLHTFV